MPAEAAACPSCGNVYLSLGSVLEDVLFSKRRSMVFFFRFGVFWLSFFSSNPKYIQEMVAHPWVV